MHWLAMSMGVWCCSVRKVSDQWSARNAACIQSLLCSKEVHLSVAYGLSISRTHSEVI